VYRTLSVPCKSGKLRLYRAPPNCTFIIEDAEAEGSFNRSVDFIHGRTLLTCFRSPSAVIARAFAALNPGGFLELQDISFPLKYAGSGPPPSSAIVEWGQTAIEGGLRAGRSWQNVQHYKRWMIEAGFEDVQEKNFYWPVNQWPKGEYYKNIGAYYLETLLVGVDAFSTRGLGLLGWDAERIREFFERVRSDFKDTNIKAYMPM